MDLENFHQALNKVRGFPLNSAQRQAVEHSDGPLWLLAGPGSGKTEVLIARALKLVCVDGLAPRSLFVTTFTKKASRSLEDRLATSFLPLQENEPRLREVDLSEMRVGTLHALCNEILQEYRYPEYLNVRLLDEIEQSLFLYRRGAIADCDDQNFWQFFHYAVPRWSENSRYPPGKWKRVSAATELFNRVAEECVNLEHLRGEGGPWKTLADYYEQYTEALDTHFRCDYAHLQLRFLGFLESQFGTRFVNGDSQTPGVSHVMVDEYQDTNPIQERIYLSLAQKAPNNLAVVGDDDQALYRFRGATVSCMVHFNLACSSAFDCQPRRIQLRQNYRSHAGIVDFFNAYISSFTEMQAPGVRAPEKEPVQAASRIAGDWPPISWLQRQKAGDLGHALAEFVEEHLIADGVISDLSQCVLLLRSPKDSPKNAGPFLRALEERSIPYYNPRSKTFMDSQEVKCLLAALVKVLDPVGSYSENLISGLPATVDSWQEAFAELEETGEDLSQCVDYIARSVSSIRTKAADTPGGHLGVTILEIIYRILSRPPFQQWRSDPVRNQRLAKVTRLFEGYHSMELDHLWANADGTDLQQSVRNTFFHMMVGYLIDAGVSDDEDEEVLVPRGMLPVMSIHQAKGLEFPVVFVAQLGQSGRVGSAQILDQTLRPFREEVYSRPLRSADSLLVEDNIRQWYVAFSRARYALVLVASPGQLRNKESVPGKDHTAFRRATPIVYP